MIDASQIKEQMEVKASMGTMSAPSITCRDPIRSS